MNYNDFLKNNFEASNLYIDFLEYNKSLNSSSFAELFQKISNDEFNKFKNIVNESKNEILDYKFSLTQLNDKQFLVDGYTYTENLGQIKVFSSNLTKDDVIDFLQNTKEEFEIKTMDTGDKISNLINEHRFKEASSVINSNEFSEYINNSQNSDLLKLEEIASKTEKICKEGNFSVSTENLIKNNPIYQTDNENKLQDYYNLLNDLKNEPTFSYNPTNAFLMNVQEEIPKYSALIEATNERLNISTISYEEFQQKLDNHQYDNVNFSFNLKEFPKQLSELQKESIQTNENIKLEIIPINKEDFLVLNKDNASLHISSNTAYQIIKENNLDNFTQAKSINNEKINDLILNNLSEKETHDFLKYRLEGNYSWNDLLGGKYIDDKTYNRNFVFETIEKIAPETLNLIDNKKLTAYDAATINQEALAAHIITGKGGLSTNEIIEADYKKIKEVDYNRISEIGPRKISETNYTALDEIEHKTILEINPQKDLEDLNPNKFITDASIPKLDEMNTETFKKTKELETESLNPERFKSDATIEQIIEINTNRTNEIEKRLNEEYEKKLNNDNGFEI